MILSDQRTAVEALGIAVAAQVPVLLWGGPGTGKSSMIRNLAESMDWPCEVVIASIREPSDFAGLPVVSGDEVRFAPPDWAKRLVDAGTGILFLDEISTAPPAVQAALLRVVLERTVGNLALPAEVAVVAAANPPKQTADGWDLSAPLANRFCHLDWSPDARTFSEGITTGWPKQTVPDLATDWELRWRDVRDSVAAFIAARPNLLFAMPTEVAAAGRAWPSPRAWETVARLLAASYEAGAAEAVRTTLVAGAVGMGAAVELLVWLADMDLGDPEEALRDPATFRVPERGDQACAALAAVAKAVATDPTPARWRAGWQVLLRAGEQAPDIAAVAARILAGCRPDGVRAPDEIAVFAPLFQAAELW